MDRTITFFAGSLRGGGAEKVAVNLANHFCNNGYKVNFLVLNLNNAVYQDLLDKEVYLHNFKVKHSRKSFLPVLRYCLKHKPKFFLCFTHEIAIVLIILRILTNLKYTLIARNINTLSLEKELQKSYWHKHVKDWILKILYRKVDHLIVQSTRMKEDMIDNYNFRTDQMSVINNPLAPEFEISAKSIQTSSIKINELLFVGRLSKQKGLYYLLNSFKKILIKNSNLKLRIIGQGELESELKNYVFESGMENNIIFDGFKSNLLPYYKQAKLTVLTSIYEGFPNVLLESIAAGTPVVSFDCKSGPIEIIEKGINGFLVRYKDTDHFVSTVLKALTHNWDFKKIKKTSLQYESKKILKSYLEIIQNTKNKYA